MHRKFSLSHAGCVLVFVIDAYLETLLQDSLCCS